MLHSPLLSNRTRDDQDRLLRKAVALAFHGWRISVQGIPLAFFVALSVTLAQQVLSLLKRAAPLFGWQMLTELP
jgi:hypothetical protein